MSKLSENVLKQFTILLGNIAIRMNQKLEWDAANMKFPNCPEADKFVTPRTETGLRSNERTSDVQGGRGGVF